MKRFLSKNPRSISAKTKEKMSKSKMGNSSLSGKIWINNGVVNRVIRKEEIIPKDFVKGKLPRRC